MKKELKENSVYISNYLHDTSLRNYHMLFSGRYVYVVLTKVIALELIKHLEKIGNIDFFNNNSNIICLNCYGNFITNGQACQCYESLNDHYNYIISVKNKSFVEIEETFKKLKEKNKFKKLRKNREISISEAEGSFTNQDIL